MHRLKTNNTSMNNMPRVKLAKMLLNIKWLPPYGYIYI